MPPRVAMLTNIPTPYRLPVLRELNRLVDLTVLFDGLTEPDREWKIGPQDLDFRHEFVRGLEVRRVTKRTALEVTDQRFVHLQTDLFFRLMRLKPQVVVTSEFGMRTAHAVLYGWLTRTPVIIWSEVTPHTEARTHWVRTLMRRVLAAGATRYWTNGVESSRLLCRYGAPPARIDDGMTGVDTGSFASETRRWLPERARLRAELGVDGVVFLFVGRFIELKGIRFYLEAMERLARTCPNGWSAVFVGSGPLEAPLQEWRAGHPEIPVALTGFVQPQELPRYYALSDVFVLPTLDDNWSLVALEAAVSGLPQVFSRHNGCAADLLTDPSVGCLIEPQDVPAFASALQAYVQAPPARLADSLTERFLAFYHPRQMAERALSSIEAVLRPAPTPRGRAEGEPT